CLVKEVQSGVTETLAELEEYYSPANYERKLYQS
ncbi:pyridoxamine 5'-phosphate oxidase family protein, partial [Nocardia elegans]|nr:pyridoxamine 5'-phosphate oxidase family protein [Nocardia elegans]